VFTLSDSIWYDDHATSRSTGGCLVFYQGGLVDHSSNMSEPVAMVVTLNMNMALNYIEEVQGESKEGKTIIIYTNNR
jgi:hypothetical protein